ncbi:Gfo/Idh/MocA family oxidoreductase [Bacillus tianshenii]|nr:Gfo/Idh/MocA family oxidoreductase [Bacillus tianshenii]
MINFAIVGCGHIAKKHAKAISDAEGANFYAVCDMVPEAMKPYEEEYGVKAYTELTDLCQDPEVDVVNICTPSGLHAPLALEAARNKKHVVIEKPITLTLEDADAIIEACRENNVKLSVVHPNRFRPVMMKLKNALDKGYFGKLSHINATVRWNRNQEYYDQAEWRGTKSMDGGVLMNQAIHNLDLMLWLAGDIEEVRSMSATRLRNIEAEDVSAGVVRFKNGSLGVVEAATTIYPTNLEETISIFGETGTVMIGGKTANLIKHWNVEAMGDEETDHLMQEIKGDPHGKPGHQWIIEDMVEAIHENREPIVSGEDGRKALEFVLALCEAAEENKHVVLN